MRIKDFVALEKRLLPKLPGFVIKRDLNVHSFTRTHAARIQFRELGLRQSCLLCVGIFLAAARSKKVS